MKSIALTAIEQKNAMSNNPKSIAALARADCKGGGCIGSVDDYQFVVRQVVPDRMGKRYGLSACNGCGIDATTMELVKECLVVIGTHRGPASALHLSVEKALAMASGEAES